jgi:hypothetical protein
MASMLVLVASAPSRGDQQTDFSGTWEASRLALHSAGMAGGSVIRIEQSAEAIRIRRSYGREALTNPPVVLTIRLDGSESPHRYYPCTGTV